MILVLWRQIPSTNSNGMTFKLKVNTSGVDKNVVFSIKTACILEMVSDTAKLL